MRDAQLLAILAAGPIGPEALAGLSRQRWQVAEAGIAALIAALDAIEPDPDDEPSLGSLGGYAGPLGVDQRRWAGGGAHDFEEEDEHGGDCSDDEPSLGAPEIHHDQRRWGQGSRGSRELDHDERAGLAAFGWEQRQAIDRARREAKAMLRRHQSAQAVGADATPFLADLRCAS